MKRIKLVSKRINNNRGSKWISPIVRNAIYFRDGFACLYCGVARSAGRTLTLDHVLAATLGGSDESSNLVTVCNPCNSSKNDRPLNTFCRERLLSVTAVRYAIAKHGARKLDLNAGREIVAREQSIKDYFSINFTVRA